MSGYLIHYNNYLSHHGIDGQKWGQRNGPPYPLNSDGKAAFKEKRKQERKAKRADRKYLRDTKRYNKNLEKKRQIEDRRSNNYTQYGMDKFAKGMGVGAGASVPVFFAGLNNEDHGGLNTGLTAAGITLGVSAALSTANAIKKVNKQKRVDDIKYNKLNNKLLDYEHKYGKTTLNSISTNQNKSNSTNHVNSTHALLSKDPSQMTNKELALATQRKYAEQKYKNAGKQPSYGAELGKEAFRNFTTNAAGAAGKALGNKVVDKAFGSTNNTPKVKYTSNRKKDDNLEDLINEYKDLRNKTKRRK